MAANPPTAPAGLPPAHGIIPARFASVRFPGKPLTPILGRPMFLWVWERARLCPGLISVSLATDDDRIAEAARAHGVPVVMTSPDHPGGTDRVREAAELLGISREAVVVNIQGDEPALDPACLTALISAFADPTVRSATLAYPLPRAEAANPNRVKVVCAANGDALYFSRSPLPFVRENVGAPILGHMGLYAFTRETLDRYVSLPPTILERTEKLEQLRLLENGIPMRVIQVKEPSLGVDAPEDVPAVETLLRGLGF